MSIEARQVLLSVKVHGRSEFVKKKEYLDGIGVLFSGYGIPVQKFTSGLLTAQFGSVRLPVAVVDNENFFHQVNPVPKYKIANMDASDWFENGLIVVDANWKPDSIIADAVTQALFYTGKFNPTSREIHPEGISQEARATLPPYLSQDLIGQYRGRWFQWLEQGI